VAGLPASRAGIEMSSSRSGQCSPKGVVSTASRCSGVAFNRRGNQTSGTPRVRPSDRASHMVASSKLTLCAEMVMPCLCDACLVEVYHSSDLAQGFGVTTLGWLVIIHGITIDTHLSNSFHLKFHDSGVIC